MGLDSLFHLQLLGMAFKLISLMNLIKMTFDGVFYASHFFCCLQLPN